MLTISNMKIQNYKLVDLKMILFFKCGKRWYAIIMVLKFYIICLSILTSSNEKKTQNLKVVDLVEVYNFHIKIIFI